MDPETITNILMGPRPADIIDARERAEELGCSEDLERMLEAAFAVQQEQLEKQETPPLALPFSRIERTEKHFLIPGWIPAGEIVLLAGNGGVGKSTVAADLAAAVSTGRPCFLESGNEPTSRTPGRVLFLSAEDDSGAVLRPRLESFGADLGRIFTPAAAALPDVKFGSTQLQALLENVKPVLCIIDPLQSFLPPGCNMSSRLEIRQALDSLTGNFPGVTFLILAHANKRQAAGGRDRIADSADLYDRARSVLVAGDTTEQGRRYISQEKNNYGRRQQTVLFTMTDSGGLDYLGRDDRTDFDFQAERAADFKTHRDRPAVDAAVQFLADFLADGPRDSREVSAAAEALDVSASALRKAKASLRAEDRLQLISSGFGQDKKYLFALAGTDDADGFPI